MWQVLGAVSYEHASAALSSSAVTAFTQIQPIKAACIQAGTCLNMVDREENSVSKFFDFESCVFCALPMRLYSAHKIKIQIHETGHQLGDSACCSHNYSFLH
jgi:hypothetical protein